MIKDSTDESVIRMNKMIFMSLLLNVGVLVPVSSGILTDAAWMTDVVGEFTPARGILLSIYLAILVVSVALLLVRREPMLVAPLFLIQAVYKLTTPITVGSITNPVVISNLFIAAFHSWTLSLIYPHIKHTFSNKAPSEIQNPSENVPILQSGDSKLMVYILPHV